MGAVASEITSLMIAYSTVYSDAYQSIHQSSASLAFEWGIHRGPVNSPHKWPVTRKMFPFDDVMMMPPITKILIFLAVYPCVDDFDHVPNEHRFGGEARPNIATLEECKTACLDNDACTAVDWEWVSIFVCVLYYVYIQSRVLKKMICMKVIENRYICVCYYIYIFNFMYLKKIIDTHLQ